MIRLLVVDDHPIVRQGLVTVLGDEPDIEVVQAAESAEQAIDAVRRHHPDVVLLDLELPTLDGIEAIPHLLAADEALRIIVLTAYDTEERVMGAVRAGARGYLLKGASTAEIAAGVRTVAAGGSVLEARVAARLVAEVRRPRGGPGGLSARERDVLRLVASGMANKEIAHALHITERTVKFHVTSVLNKLGADNRAQAAAIAVERRLLSR